MTLNHLQQQAADGLVRFATERTEKFAILLGPAGSGKTHTTANVLNRLIAVEQEKQRANPAYQPRVIACACPTHKSRTVLEQALRRYGVEVPSTTISALIGKAPSTTDDPDEEGKARWNQNGGAVERGSLLLLDECSMASVDDMRAIQKAINAAQAQSILTGDFSQLKPVKGQSIVDVAERIPVRFQLSEVMRSNSKGIVAMSKAVRTTGELDLDAVDGDEVRLYNDEASFIKAFTETPESVAICYTNARASQLNKAKRRHIYGPEPKDFEEQETVVLTESPYFIRRPSEKRGTWESIRVADNNSYLTVGHLGARLTTQNPFAPNRGFTYYNLSLTNPETGLTFDAEGMTYDMYINSFQPALADALAAMRAFATKLSKLDEKCAQRDEEQKYHLTESQVTRYFSPSEATWIKSAARTNPKFMTTTFQFNSNETFYVPARGRWAGLKGLFFARDYFGFRNRFAVLVYEHAFTSHRSQGSSFVNVFCDFPNLQTIRDPADRQAACYVAVSRASKSLHIRI